jgi:exodeoxyribonuclease III
MNTLLTEMHPEKVLKNRAEGEFMRFVTWNVNGLRAVLKKGLPEWLDSEQPDVLALQEIKCTPQQLEDKHLRPGGYHSWFMPAVRAGYSGVAVYSKTEPLQVLFGLGHDEFDSEGRNLTLEFPDFYLLACYFPNAGDGGRRLPYKLEYCALMEVFLDRLAQRGKPILLCGDMNIAHEDIDIHDPRGNRHQAGFLLPEREWMTRFLGLGYKDLFRLQHPEPHHYTWWSNFFKARERNKGWRLDYFIGDPKWNLPYECKHLTEVMGSDHCPVEFKLV